MKWGLVVSLIALVGWYVWSAETAKDDREKLRERLIRSEASVQSAIDRVDEFERAQEDYLNRLERMQERSAENRAVIAEVLRGLSSIELRRLADEDPENATRIINERFDALRRMFDDATSGSRGPAGREPDASDTLAGPDTD